MRFLLSLVLVLIFGVESNAQDSTTGKLTKFEYVKPIKYIRTSDDTSFRYGGQDYQFRNKRLIQKSNQVIYERLDDSNNVITSTEVKVVVTTSTIGIPDSIKESEASKSILGMDTCFPKTIIMTMLVTQQHGRHFEFWPNGELKIKGQFRNSYRVGRWKYYDKRGNKVKIRKYDDGILKYEKDRKSSLTPP